MSDMRQKNLPSDLQMLAEGSQGIDAPENGDGDDQICRGVQKKDRTFKVREEKLFSRREVEEAVKKRLARERKRPRRQQEIKGQRKSGQSRGGCRER